ncbi:glycosyltransferase family 2 protein [Photobacterium sanguinicancri]|uniref:glycosyltransferase family 2 protein n=1 Tax=Photobacterium sanguinicancri TaxID=875932 RepID=UPI0021C37B19|nr:glycosyltransferase family A protein [Photobacterium sanguinicancri]
MITILTPTYNRAYCLNELYQSLKLQSSLNFEWVIVDDGSTDNTFELINEWIKLDELTIRYFHQNNSGKHIALNEGVKHSNGELILIVDSDDKLVVDAVKIVETKEALLPSEYTGFSFRRAHFDGQLVGDEIKDSDDYDDYIDAHPTRAAKIFPCDLAYVFKKSAMEKHPFPRIIGEKFVPELLIWNAIADDGLVRFYKNIPIYLCEYLPDGLSFNFKSQLMKNPKGFGLFYRDQFHREEQVFFKAKNMIRYFQCLFYSIKKRL